MSLDLSSVRRTEFVAPTAKSIIGNDYPTLGQKIFNIAESKTEPMI